MKFTVSIFIAALGLASGANAAPAPSPKNLASIPFTKGINTTSTLFARAPVPSKDSKDAASITFTQHDVRAICQHRALPLDVAHSYSVMSNPGLDSVPDISKTCGDLWSNLRRHPGCAAASEATCREHENMEGVLVWHFTASSFCNVGMVGSAWWEATHNEFGHLECANVNELSFW
ncbi:hypothetical protein CI238_10602 [Colletotrichum incanum]|uniref:Uncharacterized protein n=1 Tax=Colletotrichum incanum TaxID=1573173 RepID=A0A167ALS6_COLIC|nr:hypothetical protein CI238_10602 [Colletotrichum incanum]OHX00827.1 hypothetical protein CSPAE12_00405 [Colletotrichum incanum]